MALLDCHYESEGFCEFTGFCEYRDESIIGYNLCIEYCKGYIRQYYKTYAELDNLTEADILLLKKANELN